MKCVTKARQLPEFTWYKSEVKGAQGSKVKLGSRANSDSEISIVAEGDLVIKVGGCLNWLCFITIEISKYNLSDYELYF